MEQVKQELNEIKKRLQQEEKDMKKEAIGKTAQSCYDCNKYNKDTCEVDESYCGNMLQVLTKYTFTEKQLENAYIYISNQKCIIIK